MDLLHTLLSFVASITIAVTLFLQTITGGLLTSEQKTAILSPTSTLPRANSPSATSSSQKVIGSSTPSVTKSTKKPEAKLISSTAATTTLPIVPVVPSPTISSEVLNTQTREALVNILCDVKGGGVRPISGSGVFIDSRGIILTNAHIGQYFLLKDYPSPNNVECTIRTGSPAQPLYRATLLYLPPTWVADNSTQLVAEQAKGTGENDYAFLLVTGAVGSTPLPSIFPHVAMDMGEPMLGESTFLAAYAAGFLGGPNIQKNLYAVSAYAAVKELFTFGTNRNIDLVSIAGTIVSQGGSSGGAVVRASDGKLRGIIATATVADSTAERDLRAITLAHINRSLAAQGQGGLDVFLSQDATAAAARFASITAPGEKDLLVKAIEHH